VIPTFLFKVVEKTSREESLELIKVTRLFLEISFAKISAPEVVSFVSFVRRENFSSKQLAIALLYFLGSWQFRSITAN